MQPCGRIQHMTLTSMGSFCKFISLNWHFHLSRQKLKFLTTLNLYPKHVSCVYVRMYICIYEAYKLKSHSFKKLHYSNLKCIIGNCSFLTQNCRVPWRTVNLSQSKFHECAISNKIHKRYYNKHNVYYYIVAQNEQWNGGNGVGSPKAQLNLPSYYL